MGQPLVLRSLARRMLNQVGALFSVSKVCKDFSSMGYSVSRETISQYVQWLEDAFFLITVPAFSVSAGEQQRRMHKVYCTDHAMAASLGARITANIGQMLENIVCVELRRHTPDLYYYTTQNKYEVDFLATLPSGERHLVQVCHSMDDATTRRRELRALTTAMQETGIENAWVVTEGHEEDIPTPTAPFTPCPPGNGCSPSAGDRLRADFTLPLTTALGALERAPAPLGWDSLSGFRKVPLSAIGSFLLPQLP